MQPRPTRNRWAASNAAEDVLFHLRTFHLELGRTVGKQLLASMFRATSTDASTPSLHQLKGLVQAPRVPKSFTMMLSVQLEGGMRVARLTSKSCRLSSTFCFFVQTFTCDADRGACTPELPLPWTHFVARGGILQRTPTRNTSADILNTALELPLPRTHFVARGGIPQRMHIRHCSTSLLLATAVKRGATPQRPCFCK